MASSFLRHMATRRLPPALLRHKKWGFGVPWVRYFREHPAFRELVRSLPELPPLNAPPYDSRAIRILIEGFLDKGHPMNEVVLHFVMLVLWHKEMCQAKWSTHV